MANNNKLHTISNKNFFIKAFLCFFIIFIFFEGSECSVRLCGYRLSKMLTTVCRSQNCAKDTEYDIHGGLEKRAVGNEGVVYEERGNLNRRNMYEQQPMKRSGGVVNDCCINRCTLEHLKTYCCGYADEEVDF